MKNSQSFYKNQQWAFFRNSEEIPPVVYQQISMGFCPHLRLFGFLDLFDRWGPGWDLKNRRRKTIKTGDSKGWARVTRNALEKWLKKLCFMLDITNATYTPMVYDRYIVAGFYGLWVLMGIISWFSLINVHITGGPCLYRQTNPAIEWNRHSWWFIVVYGENRFFMGI